MRGKWRERDNSLAQLQREVDGAWYGLTPAKGNPCLWAVVRLHAENGLSPKKGKDGGCRKATRSLGVQTEGQDKPVEVMGGLVTYVDDLLFAMPEVHMQPFIPLLLKKYVMKQSGSLASESQTVTLKPSHRPPEVDERLPDEVLPDSGEKEACVRLPAVHRTSDVAGHKDKSRLQTSQLFLAQKCPA